MTIDTAITLGLVGGLILTLVILAIASASKKDKYNPNPARYERRRDLKAPKWTKGVDGTCSIEKPVSGYVVNGRVYGMKRKEQKKLAAKKKSGRNGYGWEYEK